tara:strand:- start:324 stop:1085 length:762 start_codon:yes stop_codon:yes gene_type:complete
MMKNLLLSFLLTMAFLTVVWGQLDPRETFEAANSAYATGDYESAIDGYESILAQNMHFESEYNIGNAHYKMEHWGPAILHYERAALMSPSNSDVKANLTLANSRIKDRIESLPSNGILNVWERITAPGRFQLWSRIMLLTWTLGFSLLAWRIWVLGIENRRLLGSGAVFFILIGFAAMVLTRSVLLRIESSKSAIVMAIESAVRNEPESNAMTLFMLHEGTKVKVIDRTSTHWKIQLSNGNIGWIAAADLTEI